MAVARKKLQKVGTYLVYAAHEPGLRVAARPALPEAFAEERRVRRFQKTAC